jgi:hypothetical protein
MPTQPKPHAGNPNVDLKAISAKLEKTALKIFKDADTTGDAEIGTDEYEVLIAGNALKGFMDQVQQEVMTARCSGFTGGCTLEMLFIGVIR